MNTHTARTKSSLTPMVETILNIPLEAVVPDGRPLIAALLLSHPDEEVRLRRDYVGDEEMDLFFDSLSLFRQNNKLLKAYIDDGFFVEAAEYFLNAAEMDRDSGARLMPVFCSIMTNADYLKIPGDLQQRIIKHMDYQLEQDGFAIRLVSFDKVDIYPAEDVLDA